MTTTRRPLIITGACLEPAAGRAALCCAPRAKPKAESAQQQPVKTIPAQAPKIFLRNSLRVGMFRFLCCCGTVVKLRGRHIPRPHATAKTPVRLFRHAPERAGLYDPHKGW